MERWRLRSAVGLFAAGLALSACQRPDRDPTSPPLDTPPRELVVSGIAPGGGAPATPADAAAESYQSSSVHLANGQRLFQWYNCTGCHFNGGGGIGPALMDSRWRYGGSIENIAASILQGRPNGMPSFRGKIPQDQVWEIAAYVRSLSGNADKLAASSRPEGMSSIPPINNIDKQPPGGDAEAAGAPR